MLARLAGCLGLSQETGQQQGSPRTAPTSPTAALALPPADSLPLASGSLAFAVPPSLDAALDVLAAQQPSSPKAASIDVITETAAACAAGLRSYRQRMAPEQRRRERRRLSREQADHLKTLEQLGRGLQVAPAPAVLPLAAGGGPVAKAPPQKQQQTQRQAPPPPFVLAPVFQTAHGAAAGTQLVPLHRGRQVQPVTGTASTAQPNSAGHAAAAAAGAPTPASSAGSASMQSATSRLAGEEALASSGSGSGTASAAILLPHTGLGRSSAATGGSGACLDGSTRARAATSAAASAAGGSPSTACQGGTSPTTAWAAGGHGLSGGSAAWEEGLIELELVDASGACVERLPPQPSPQPPPLPPSGRTARPSPDTDEAVPAHTTPSFLAFVVGVTQMGSLAGGASGQSSACNSTAASHPPAQAGDEGSEAATAAAATDGSPGTAAACSGSGSTNGSVWYTPEAGLPAVSSQVALLDGPELGSTGSPRSGGSSQVSSSAAAAAASQAGAPAGSGGTLLSSFKQALHGRLQQRAVPRQAAHKPLGGTPLAAAGKERASTHVVAVAAAAAAVGADAEDVLPRRPAVAGRRSANENWPALV